LGDGEIIRWWSDPQARTRRKLPGFRARDGAAFLEVDRKLKALAAYLQPLFLESAARTSPRAGCGTGLREGLRMIRRFRRIRARSGEMVQFLTGSLGEFLDRHIEADATKRMILANNVYGKHGGPYEPGSTQWGCCSICSRAAIARSRASMGM